MAEKIPEFTEAEWEADVAKNADTYDHYWNTAAKEMTAITSNMNSVPPENYLLAFGINVRKLSITDTILKIVSQDWADYRYVLDDTKIIYPEFRYNFKEEHLKLLEDKGITVDLSKLNTELREKDGRH